MSIEFMNHTENEPMASPYTTNMNAPIVLKTRILSSDFCKKDSRTNKVASIPISSFILFTYIRQKLLSCI